jgi:hypothetical protein
MARPRPKAPLGLTQSKSSHESARRGQVQSRPIRRPAGRLAVPSRRKILSTVMAEAVGARSERAQPGRRRKAVAMRLRQPIESRDKRLKPKGLDPAQDAALSLRKSESEHRSRVGVVCAADDALLKAAQGFARLGGRDAAARATWSPSSACATGSKSVLAAAIRSRRRRPAQARRRPPDRRPPPG